MQPQTMARTQEDDVNIGNADYWIRTLNLKQHPEGGYYKEVYRAQEEVQSHGRTRSASTSIYFLLRAGEFSALHQIQSDELWHFYAGSPLTVHRLCSDGAYRSFVLGQDVERGENLQNWVPSGDWFGATVATGYALVGCTVAPGFEFQDFRMGVRAELLEMYPQQEAIIRRLTHG